MPVNLQAGNLTHLVSFERLGKPVSDGAGNEVRSWIPYCQRSAQIKAVPVTNASAETVIQGRLTGIAFVTIIVRFDATTRTLAAEDRATDDDGTVYNIRSALDLDGDRRWVTLDCQKGVAT